MPSPISSSNARPAVYRSALPEYHDYRDTGCLLHSACLTCPESSCAMETRMGVNHVRLRNRDRRVHLARSNGSTVRQLMAHFSLSRRTVYRVLSQRRLPLS